MRLRGSHLTSKNDAGPPDEAVVALEDTDEAFHGPCCRSSKTWLTCDDCFSPKGLHLGQ
jgi:hypothetical protein